MRCVAGHQPNLYPYGGFFAKASAVNTFVIADNTQYVKKEYHNRNRILLSDGTVHWLGVPVKNSGNYRSLINNMIIDNSQNWRRVHRKTLEANYGAAPFFDCYYPKLRTIINRDWENLSDFNIAVIKYFFSALDIKTTLCLASELGVSGKATSYILDICLKTGTMAYLHGKHAKDYVDFEYLQKNGVNSFIQDFSAIFYKQIHSLEFCSNLSILDIIFNCGKETMTHLKSCQKIYAVKDGDSFT